MSELFAGHWELLLLPPIPFVGALVFGVAGFGAALVTIPLATQFVRLELALALFAVSDLSMALAVGLGNPLPARSNKPVVWNLHLGPHGFRLARG